MLKIMQQFELDLLIASSPENVFYLSKYHSISQNLLASVNVFCAINKSEHKSIILSAQELSAFNEDNNHEDFFIYPYGSPNGPVSAFDGLIQLIKKYPNNCKIGLDESRITPIVWQNLQEYFPKITFVPAAAIFYEIRKIKTKDEIQLLTTAAAITEDALIATIAQLKIGMSEQEIAKIFMGEIIKNGAMPLFNVITIDERSALGDTIVTTKTLKKNSILRFDVGCDYKGYKSDIARTVVFGKLSAKLQNYLEAIHAGVDLVISHLKPGVKAQDIFHIACAEVSKVIPHYKRHHCGHGIGLEVYEMPTIAPTDQTILEEAMVLSIETPYYEPFWGGIQVEDMVVITNNGAKRLSGSDLVL